MHAGDHNADGKAKLGIWLRIWHKAKGFLIPVLEFLEKIYHHVQNFLHYYSREFLHYLRKWTLRYYRRLRLYTRGLKTRSFWHELYRRVVEKILARDLWVVSRNRVAGGVALGLFVAFFPIFGIQMLVAGLLAGYFRVNIPSALLMCWVTNPLTALPILYLQFKVGQFFAPLFNLPVSEFTMADFKSVHPQKFFSFGTAFSIGIIFVAVFFSGLGYVISYTLWEPLRRLINKVLQSKALHPIQFFKQRKLAKANKNKDKNRKKK